MAEPAYCQVAVPYYAADVGSDEDEDDDDDDDDDGDDDGVGE